MSQGGKKGMAKRWQTRGSKDSRGGGSKKRNNPLDTPLDNPLDNSKEVNTTLTGSISKAGPSAGARGPALDGAATAAGDDEPATDEEMQAALDEMKRD